jgi:hypothetical protein
MIVKRKSIRLKNNFNDIISQDEVISCIKLLPNYKQYIPKNSIKIGTKPEKSHRGGGMGGIYNYKRKDIKIHKCYEYNSYNINTQKIIIICALIHELRHSYQNKSRKDFNKLNIDYNKNRAYAVKNNPLEIDAYGFTSKFMRKIEVKLIKF